MRLGSARRPANAVPAAECLSDGELLQQFTTHNDHEAFAALVRRHGPMVFGVCRRVLLDSHDAEEAFQSTFLVLVRKAGGLAQPERLGNWLHGVAQRTAAKLKVAAARRAAHEAGAGPTEAAPPDTDWADIRQALDEELVALPEKYRAPLVMCYLQGLTNEEAARRLGWPTGSMSYRLARGRELLRDRLHRRGVCFWSLPLAFGVCTRATAREVPEPLVDQTVRRAAEQQAARPAGRWTARAMALWLLLLLFGLGTVTYAAVPARSAPPPAESAEPAVEQPPGQFCGRCRAAAP
ncbi:MAG TPA: sigma-70 family RNA polymerase sigma factor [Gemmataceae bacterium]|jgi:RNA polymerase sigma factor (sigma-70 family)|nr:sigma-70 family RNA polymerase sigma factor [Gemmataceae bacterium]